MTYTGTHNTNRYTPARLAHQVATVHCICGRPTVCLGEHQSVCAFIRRTLKRHQL